MQEPHDDQTIVKDGASQSHPEQRDTLRSVVWAAILIGGGAVALAHAGGLLPRYGNAGVWDWVMLLVGGLLVLEALIRAASPDLKRPSTFWTILGCVLLALSVSAIFSVEIELRRWWPAILILVGVLGLLRAIRH